MKSILMTITPELLLIIPLYVAVMFIGLYFNGKFKTKRRSKIIPHLLSMQCLANTPGLTKALILGTKYLEWANFGNLAPIRVESFTPNITYMRVVKEIETNPFVTDHIVVTTDTRYIHDTVVQYERRTESGAGITIPMPLIQYVDVNELNQCKEPVFSVIINDQVLIDGLATLSADLRGNQKINFAIYKSNIPVVALVETERIQSPSFN